MKLLLQRLRPWIEPITAIGWLVAAMSTVGWFFAWQLGWEEMAVLAGACLMALVVAVPFTLGRMDLETELRLQPKRVVAGERAGGELVVRNPGSVRSLPLSIELIVGSGMAQFTVPSLAPGAVHDELFTLPTNRRAVLQVGPVSSVRSDPLGLVRRERRWSGMEELFIHPHTSRLDRLGAGFLRDLEGQATNELSPSDIAFHTLREYVPGDDRRHIHWRTSAKQNKLMVRQFVDTRRSELVVMISELAADYRDEAEFELAVSLAASFALRALRDEQTVRFVGGGRPMGSSTGQTLLDSCARLDPRSKGGDLLDCVGIANRVAGGATMVVLVTGSISTQESVRQAASLVATQGRMLLFRADTEGVLRRRQLGQMTTLDVPALDQFERGLFLVMQQ